MNSALSMAQRVVLTDQVLIQHLAGESVLLHLNQEVYYGLNETGTRMLSVLGEKANIQAAYEQLLDEYEIEPEKLRHDLLDLVEKCVAHGLVKVIAA